MELTNKKLEELIYLSLIGKFCYWEKQKDEMVVCFVASKIFNDDIKKPIYITSSKYTSDKIALKRLEAFEQKVFTKDKSLANTLKNDDTLSYSRRIKKILSKSYQNFEVLEQYKINIENLNQEWIIDEFQYQVAKEYVAKKVEEIKANNDDKTF